MRATQKVYLIVEWSEEDEAYLGSCPELFPYGAVCHGDSAGDAYLRLLQILEDLP
jgi:hypothetical protein